VSTGVGADANVLEIAAGRALEATGIGDSISVDGCCLTVTSMSDGTFTADLMAETLRVTTLGGLVSGDRVNLERAAAIGDRLGSHLVQGHVDGVGRVRAVETTSTADTALVTIEVPDAFLPLLVPKGSVTVAGVGLTVVEVLDDAFTVGLIPHTREVTTLGALATDDRVNLELDVVAKYVARLLAAGVHTPYGDGLVVPPKAGP
jgi:riboflavin synthase